MKTNEEDGQCNGVLNINGYGISKLLQDDTLTERICSDLEQLKYAQILTSLAMGPPFCVHHDTSAAGEQQHHAVRSRSKSEVLQADGKEIYRRERRQVKPTKKIRELRERNVGKLQKPLGKSRNSEDKRGTESSRKKTDEAEKDKSVSAIISANRGYPGVELVSELTHKNKKQQEAVEKSSTVTTEEPRKKTSPDVSGTVDPMLSDKKETEPRNSKSRYRCNQCGKYFKTYYTYTIHIRMPKHTTETPFVCDICGKGFRLSSTLCRHKIIHTSSKPHQCKTCFKNFNRSSTLKMHMRTHSSRKQHVCAQCGKGFHQKGNLRNHMFVHSGERPFQCESCGRHFNKKSNLKHHLKIHEINGKLACTVCKTMFPGNEELKKHMVMVHCQ